MPDKEPTRAAKLAAQLKNRQAELVSTGVLPARAAKRVVKLQDRETPEQKQRRREALEKLRTFLE